MLAGRRRNRPPRLTAPTSLTTVRARTRGCWLGRRRGGRPRRPPLTSFPFPFPGAVGGGEPRDDDDERDDGDDEDDHTLWITCPDHKLQPPPPFRQPRWGACQACHALRKRAARTDTVALQYTVEKAYWRFGGQMAVIVFEDNKVRVAGGALAKAAVDAHVAAIMQSFNEASKLPWEKPVRADGGGSWRAGYGAVSLTWRWW